MLPLRLKRSVTPSARSRPPTGETALTTISNGSSAAKVWPASAIARSNPSSSTKRANVRQPRSVTVAMARFIAGSSVTRRRRDVTPAG